MTVGKTLVRWLLAVVVVASGLTLTVVPVMAPVASAAPGDRDDDGVLDEDDPCPDTFGTPDDEDGFAGCVPIPSVVTLSLTDGRLHGQVEPQGQWKGQDVCLAGVSVRLDVELFDDHDRETGPQESSEISVTDETGTFEFTHQLAIGTRYAATLVASAIPGAEAYCASSRSDTAYHSETVPRTVVATYQRAARTVAGTVTVQPQPGSQVEGPCSDEQFAQVWRQIEGESDRWIDTAPFSGAEGTFAVPVPELAIGGRYYVEIMDRAPIGFPDHCLSARSESFTVVDDNDEDGVLLPADRCPEVPGPAGGDFPGCATIQREITAAYATQQVLGTVTTSQPRPPGTGSACQGQATVSVFTIVGSGAHLPIGSAQTSGTGAQRTYSVDVGFRQPGTRYYAKVDALLDGQVAVCGAATSPVKAIGDADDDGVLDEADKCPAVPGRVVGNFGCPVVERSVSASYASQIISGRITLDDLGGAPAGSCEVLTEVRIYTLADDGTRILYAVTTAAHDGTFAERAGNLPMSARVVVVAAAVDDLPRATCTGAETPTFGVRVDRDGDLIPDELDPCPGVPGPSQGPGAGCPVLDRQVTASYDTAVVTGRIDVVGAPASVPADACLPTQVQVLRTDGPAGAVTIAQGPTASNGTFRFTLAGPLPDGTRLTVTSARFFDDPRGICDEARSDELLVEDGDDDGVPDGRDACPGIPGPDSGDYAGCPSFELKVSAIYGDGTMAGEVELVDPEAAPPGACTAPTYVLAFGVIDGATVWLGQGATDDLGTGSYRFDLNARLEPGTPYFVTSTGYLDPDKGFCKGARSEDRVTDPDRDGDGVPDATDECPIVAGTSAAGCPRLDRIVWQVSVSGAVVRGRVSVTNPDDAPAGACSGAVEVELWKVLGDDDEERVMTSATSQDGGFGFVGGLDAGASYVVKAPRYVDGEQAECAAARSEVVQAPGDTDGDGVLDDADACVDVPGDNPLVPGCPTAVLEVGAAISGTDLVGEVVVRNAGDVPAGACLPAEVQLMRVDDGGGTTQLDTQATEPDGTYRFAAAGLAEGTTVFVSTPTSLELPRALCAGARSDDVVVPAAERDGDGDGVVDAADDCPDVAGDSTTAPGCPSLTRIVWQLSINGTAVRGAVSVTNAGAAPAGACSGAVEVELWKVLGPADEVRVATSTTTADGRFGFVGGLEASASYVVKAPRFVDGEVAECLAARSDPVQSPADTDGDGVLDDADQCVDAVGADETFPGCPVVEQAVTASYAQGRVTGQVSTVDSDDAPAGACAGPASIALTQRGPDGGEVVGELTTDPDGTYLIDLDETLAIGASYYVSVEQGADLPRAVCAAAQSSDFVVPASDSDGDGVRDADDACVEVKGASSGAALGCPTLTRSVVASTDGVVVTGRVSVTNPGAAPAGACGSAAVELYRIGSGGSQTLVASATAAGDGGFALTPSAPLVAGTVYVVRAPGWLDAPVAVCGSARSENVKAPDRDGDLVADATDACPDVKGVRTGEHAGCPLLTRSVTAAIADGVVSGQVAVTDLVGTPPGTCLSSTLELYRVDAGGTYTLVGSGTSVEDGRFVIEPTVPLVAGPVYFVRALADFDDPDASCAMARSANVKLLPPPDRDGDGVVDDADACADVPGPASAARPGCPSLSRSVLASVAGGMVSGLVSVTNPAVAPEGACLSSTVELYRVGAGGSTTLVGSGISVADGRFVIEPTVPLVSGPVYFVRVLADFDDPFASCAVARSANVKATAA